MYHMPNMGSSAFLLLKNTACKRRDQGQAAIGRGSRQAGRIMTCLFADSTLIGTRISQRFIQPLFDASVHCTSGESAPSSSTPSTSASPTSRVMN